jgi:uncharacterized protein (DUF362 family)
MMLSIAQDQALHATLDEIGLGTAIREGGSVLIKVNLARLPEPGHPRTDPALLAHVVRYVARCEARCAIAEGADGFLRHNVECIGLGGLVRECRVRVLDLDLEDADCVSVGDQAHYLPKCLRDYAVRVGMPATSKRPGMTFSNNVKLFVGVVPRRLYQDGRARAPRPRVHDDLHRSVADIYRAVMAYAPFGFFVNGGKAMFENRGEADLPEILVSNDALELDQFLLERFGLERPEYIRRLAAGIDRCGTRLS